MEISLICLYLVHLQEVIMRVLSLTPAQIQALPPLERDTFMQIVSPTLTVYQCLINDRPRAME